MIAPDIDLPRTPPSDADVRLAPSALRAATGYAEAQGLDLLSGWGSLTMDSFWEKVMQPVVVEVHVHCLV